MPRLTDFLDRSEFFRTLVHEGADADASTVARTFLHPYLVAGVLARKPWRAVSCLVVAPSDEQMEELRHELALYLPDRRVHAFPARGVWYGPEVEVPPRVVGRRCRALAGLAHDDVVVVEAATLMEEVRPGAGDPVTLRVGEPVEFDTLLHALVDLGYERVDQVEEPGEFSVRGGLVDVFPSTESTPARVEFWGDEVESIRSFSVFSQRSLGALEELTLVAAAEDDQAPPASLLSLLRDDARLILVDPARAVARVEAFQADLLDIFGSPTRRENGGAAAPDAGEEDRDALLAAAGFYLSGQQVEAEAARFTTLRVNGPGGSEVGPRGSSGDLPITSLPDAERELERLMREGNRVVVAFEHPAEAERAGYILRRVSGRVAGPSEVPQTPGLTFLTANHRRHFIMPDLGLALLTEAQIFPRRRKPSAERRLVIGGELSSFRDLRKGDYVVHEDHGIGRFEGISTKTVSGITRDYLDIAFRDADMLYIPHDQITKVSRYVGSDASAPSLSKLGGKAWDHLKSRVRKAVREIAGDLLQLYAMRQASQGIVFSEDGEWQRRFEGAFPYEETEDQLLAIDAVKDDMESPSPMDRLICGDVGYGKTEVALRAAFKAVMDSKQVMMLVPTTILAQQHFGTFRERFAEFPVKVDMVSRFRTPKEQRRIVKEFREGEVDVLIGTHRVLSQDVQPKDLGLVIVDEEQRFGVSQKEALRRLKVKTDVLALSATPIPRTLQMSLAGVRDISVIETPPRDRHPIQTYVGTYDEGMVQRAIEREIGRGGQVFYLHNRVETIDKVTRRLQELMPAVRFGVAHGQMNEQTLEKVMLAFLRGDYDVLVSTTIIESGLDIPNANTLIVERADLLGLSQLYQIRGRIGRSSRVAHAFLFHPDEAVLTHEAIERLSTLADYTELGSGFKIAMRDLEIRGAGNLLGDEQSGHIAAVGFEMYLSMLRETVEALQGGPALPERVPRVDLDLSAYVPSSFIAYEAAKVDLHQRIAGARRREQLTELRAELTDRFGPLPEPVDNLIFLGEVRVALEEVGAESLTARQWRLTITGLELPPGSREALRQRDRRYVYTPAGGRLTLTYRGDAGGSREAVEQVLDAILHLRSEAVEGVA